MKKKILIHDYAGHPFQVQLSRELARRGYDVLHLYYGLNNTPKGNIARNEHDAESFSIEPISTKEPVRKYSYIKRWLQDHEYGRLVASKIREFKPDYLLSANTPLDSQKIILKACQNEGTRFIFWLQDVSGIAAKKLLSKKIPVIGSLVGNYHIKLERRLLRSSYRVVLISDDFNSIVQQWDINKDNIRVIPNWATLDELPVKDKKNHWAVHHGLQDKFCFLYTGGLGFKQNPDLLLQLAIHFNHDSNVRVVVISEGPGGRWLKEKIAELNLGNLNVLDYQPYEMMPDVMGAGDVLLTTQEADAGEFCVPSKVLSYLCAERAQLLAIPLDNLAARIINQNNAGFVVPAGDLDSFINSAERLYKEDQLRSQMGINGRKYADETFNITKITDEFEKMFIY